MTRALCATDRAQRCSLVAGPLPSSGGPRREYDPTGTSAHYPSSAHLLEWDVLGESEVDDLDVPLVVHQEVLCVEGVGLGLVSACSHVLDLNGSQPECYG